MTIAQRRHFIHGNCLAAVQIAFGQRETGRSVLQVAAPTPLQDLQILCAVAERLHLGAVTSNHKGVEPTDLHRPAAHVQSRMRHSENLSSWFRHLSSTKNRRCWMCHHILTAHVCLSVCLSACVCVCAYVYKDIHIYTRVCMCV